MYVPERTCLVCRRKAAKAELIRIVKSGDEVLIDESGNRDGRGAYLCNDPKCIEKCIAKKMLNRSFKAQLKEGIYEALRKLSAEN